MPDYYRSGANFQQTLIENQSHFQRYRFRRNFFHVDVSQRSLSTTILGQRIDFPVCIAPTAMQKMADPVGEGAAALAASSYGIPYTLSTVATSSVEEVGKAAPACCLFLQVYIFKDREVTTRLVRRAEEAGYKALLLTVDTLYLGRRYADVKNQFKLPGHLCMANFAGMNTHAEKRMGESKGDSGLAEYAASLFDPSLTWKDVQWLKSITNLPVVVKGILTGTNAVEAIENGVDGILVSNHGARQLDGVSSTIGALEEVVKAVDGRCEVYLDGGVRTGTDILKALALGARAVFIGRPILWGLACGGEEGVKKVLQILRDELDLAMALAGVNSVSTIPPDLVKLSSCGCMCKL